jgi:hypothetical protein
MSGGKWRRMADAAIQAHLRGERVFLAAPSQKYLDGFTEVLEEAVRRRAEEEKEVAEERRRQRGNSYMGFDWAREGQSDWSVAFEYATQRQSEPRERPTVELKGRAPAKRGLGVLGALLSPSGRATIVL